MFTVSVAQPIDLSGDADPFGGLAGDASDEIGVLVAVEHGQSGEFGGHGDDRDQARWRRIGAEVAPSQGGGPLGVDLMTLVPDLGQAAR